MELVFIICIGTLVACGLYLMLRQKMLPVILGLMLISHAANLLILLMGRLRTHAPPILNESQAQYTDPLSQAFILTAIVIGFAVFALLLVVSLRGAQESGTDSVNEIEDLLEKGSPKGDKA